MGLFHKDETDLIASYQKLSDEQKTAFMAAINTPAPTQEPPAQEPPTQEPKPAEPNEPTDSQPAEPGEPKPTEQNPPESAPSTETAQEPATPPATPAPTANYVDATTFAEAIKALGDKFDAAIQNLSSMAQKGADMADRLSEEEKKAEGSIGYGKLKQGINGNAPGVGKTYAQLRKETIGY